MTFARVNLLGWAPLEELTAAQQNQLDIDHTNTIDLLGGGIHSVGADVTVDSAATGFDFIFTSDAASGGNFVVTTDNANITPQSGLVLDATSVDIGGVGHTITGTGTWQWGAGTDLSLLGAGGSFNIDAGNSIAIDSEITLSDGLTNSGGTVNLTGGSFSVGGGVSAVSWNAQVNFGGLVNLNDDVNFGTSGADTFDFLDGVVTFGSSVDLNLQTPVVTSGTGRVRQRFHDETDGTANKTITSVTADHYFIETGVLTANRNWTISDTNCADGDWIMIYCAENASGFSISVRDPTPSTIATIDHQIGSGNSPWVKVARIGGAWRVVARGAPM